MSAVDRVFGAALVINPVDALLQQGHVWTVANMFTVPRNGGTQTLTWQVPDVFAYLSFAITADRPIEGSLAFVNSFTGGEEIIPFNRNSRFAQTATPPKTMFLANPTILTQSPTTATGLFPGSQVAIPTFIVNSLHQCFIMTNNEPMEARVWPLVIFHEKPEQKFPAGDQGP